MLADYQKEIDHFNEMQYGYEIINTDMAYKFYYGVVYEREPEYYKIAPLNHYMVDIMRLPRLLGGGRGHENRLVKRGAARGAAGGFYP